MSDAMDTKASEELKRKEPEAAAEKPASEENDAKKIKSSANPAVIRKQVEYYLSDDNLKHDKFFHEKITASADGWLEVACVLQCNKMKAMRATKEDVIEALKESSIEIAEGGASIRRPQNAPLPAFVDRAPHHKKNAIHAHEGGVICAFRGVPEEQSWTQVREKLKENLPKDKKVQVWFVSEVNDKNECFVACSPFEEDQKFFDSLTLEVGSAKLKSVVIHGDELQKVTKTLPKHIREKREKEQKKRQKERNKPILIGTQKFANVAALRGRVKEIIQSRSDGEQLKADGSDYKLIKSLIEFHPTPDKAKGMTALKVGKAPLGDNRCFFMILEGGKEDDVSMKKCLDAVELNPPYAKSEAKAESPSPSKDAAAPAAEAKPATEEKASPSKDAAGSAEAKA